MKANHRPRRSLMLVTAALGSLIVGGCNNAPAPAPPPSPPVVRATPLPPTVRPALGWRDMPITPGTWIWTMTGPRSTASFGLAGAAPLVTLTCEKSAGEVRLARTGKASAHVAMAVTTTTGSRPLVSEPALSPDGWVVAQLKVRDPILDAMAFSRGRFALDVAGLPTLYLPSWPEVARVVEDCR